MQNLTMQVKDVLLLFGRIDFLSDIFVFAMTLYCVGEVEMGFDKQRQLTIIVIVITMQYYQRYNQVYIIYIYYICIVYMVVPKRDAYTAVKKCVQRLVGSRAPDILTESNADEYSV